VTQHQAAGERLYQEAIASYGAALERLARGYERDADRRRDRRASGTIAPN
jgi:hypothetical protein